MATAINPDTAERAKKYCFLANRILANEGLFDGFGHVSIRNPENSGTFFQSCSCSPEFVTIADILEIDLDGNVLTKTDKKPYGERFIHSEILRLRSDVNAVYHGHPGVVVALSIAGIPYRPVTHTGAIFYDEIPVFDAYDISNGTLTRTPTEGKRLAACLDQSRALIMKNHGLVVVGEGVIQMVMGAIFFRDNCQTLCMAHAMCPNQISSLSREMGIVSIGNHITHEGVLSRTWNYWVARAKKNIPELANI